MRALPLPATLRMLPVLLPVLATGCPRGAPVSGAPATAPSSNDYLRSSFDTDPSSFLARFLPSGLDDLDESNAMTLACSQHVSWRFIDGGGVRMTELLNASTEVTARFGVPLIASGKAQASRTQAARVEYTLTGKMVSEITNPDAFAACCKAQPDQCTDRLVGEFLQGTGAVSFVSTQAAEARAEGRDPGTMAGGDVAFSHGTAWQRAAEFPNPVYFAFKVTPTPYTQQAVSTCPAWVDTPPQVDGGTYVVGRSKPAKTEAVARRKAQNNANVQALRASGATASALQTGNMPALRVDDWCVEAVTDGGDTRYVARALAFLGDDEAKRMRAPALVQGVGNIAGGLGAAFSDAAGGLADAGAALGRDAGAPLPTMAPAPAATPPPPGPGYAALLAQVHAQSFDTDKVALALAGGAQLRMTTQQLRGLLDALSFDTDKVTVAVALRPAITDPQNVEVLMSAFSFSTDQATVRAAYR